MDACAESLAGTGEVGPVEKIEVGLLEFGKSHKAVNRTESRTKVERSGLFLLDDDIEILTTRHQSVLGSHIDL